MTWRAGTLGRRAEPPPAPLGPLGTMRVAARRWRGGTEDPEGAFTSVDPWSAAPGPLRVAAT
jgi:hypothetical protein